MRLKEAAEQYARRAEMYKTEAHFVAGAEWMKEKAEEWLRNNW